MYYAILFQANPSAFSNMTNDSRQLLGEVMTSPARLMFATLICIAALLQGCASTPTASSEDQFSELMMQTEFKVAAALEDGDKDEAVRVVSNLAAANPDRKEPWVRIAKIHFDSTDYAQAIVAAEEALDRDPNDSTAKSIRAVSGLRVAAESLNDLRNDVDLKGNARADATDLAMTMRDILGEDVLVPPAELEARKKREAEAAKRRALRAKRRSDVVQQRQPEPVRAAPASNPFSSLQ